MTTSFADNNNNDDDVLLVLVVPGVHKVIVDDDDMVVYICISPLFFLNFIILNIKNKKMFVSCCYCSLLAIVSGLLTILCFVLDGCLAGLFVRSFGCLVDWLDVWMAVWLDGWLLVWLVICLSMDRFSNFIKVTIHFWLTGWVFLKKT